MDFVLFCLLRSMDCLAAVCSDVRSVSRNLAKLSTQSPWAVPFDTQRT